MIRHPRAHVPAFTGRDLPAVFSITESRTVYLYRTDVKDALTSFVGIGVTGEAVVNDGQDVAGVELLEGARHAALLTVVCSIGTSFGGYPYAIIDDSDVP